MTTNIILSESAITVGRNTYDLSNITPRQYGILEEEVRQHLYRVDQLERSMAALTRSYEQMTDQVADGFRWSTDFVARDAVKIADEVTMVRSTEQAIVVLLRALGVI